MKGWQTKRRTYIKHLKQLLLRYYESLELLLFLDCALGHLFESWVVGVRDWSELRHKYEKQSAKKKNKTYRSSMAIS